MKYCEVCGAEVQDSEQTCPVCGYEFPEAEKEPEEATGEKVRLDPELIRRAMKGDEDAFREIYEKTYKFNYYVTRKYMKTDASAEDVLQEAYIKIWTHLPGLQNPEGYVNWSRRIVANTALNELRKTEPMLFSEMSNEGEDGSEMEFQVEDTYLPNQPELNFTEKEEHEIIRSMVESLSDEQRLCIMMYYMEEIPVREIAETLGVSEGTVKSRLNYGRQNIKAKAEELEKKGYNFKGISALGVLLLLLGREAVRFGAGSATVEAAAVTAAAGAGGAVMQPVSLASNATGTGVANGAGTTAGAGAVNGAGAANGAGMGTANAAGTTAGAGAVNGAGTTASAEAANGTGNAAGTGMPAGTPQKAVFNETANAGTGNAVSSGAIGQAGAAKAAGAGIMKTMAGKILLFLGGAAVVGGITVAVIMMNKDKDEPKLEAENVTTEIQVVTEDLTEAASDTVATTEAATEPATEAVTEEPAEYYAYVDEYAQILEKNREQIKIYEQEFYWKGNEKSVAMVNVLGDENPELFFITQKSQNEMAISHVYTMQDGKAVSLLPDDSYFAAAAGGSLWHCYRTSKNVDGFYDESSGGDESYSGTVQKVELDGRELKRKDVEKWSSKDDNITYSMELSPEEEADMGDIILYCGTRGEEDETVLGTSYDDMMPRLEELKTANYHEPGWQKIDDKWFYYDQGGHMLTGWQEIDGAWYFLSSKTGMATGWQTIKGKTYYFRSEGKDAGKMCTGKTEIDGVVYQFDENGVLLEGADHLAGDQLLEKLAKEIKYYEDHGEAMAGGELNFDGIMSVFGPDKVTYAYYDLDKDGTDELILEGYISAVISFKSGEPVYLIRTMSDREGCGGMKNGHIVKSTREGAASHNYTEYEINADGNGLTEVKTVLQMENPEEWQQYVEFLETQELELNTRPLSDFI